MRVALVEDNEEVRQRLRWLLSEIPGARVVSESESASEAILQLRRCDPHVVIVDLQLQGSSGLEVLEYLQVSASPAEVIVLTNFSDAAYRERCARLGASHFLSKGKEVGTLRRLLTTLAEEHTKNLE